MKCTHKGGCCSVLSSDFVFAVEVKFAVGLQRYTGFKVYFGMKIDDYHTVYICLSEVLKNNTTGWRISSLFWLFYKETLFTHSFI